MIDRRSPEAIAYRRLYKTQRWQLLRERRLLRDGYACRMCGRLLNGKHRKGGHSDDNAPDVDHVIDHKGDTDLFFDIENLQSLCHYPCHSKWKQQHQARGYSTAIGADGWPVDPMHPANR